MVPDDIQELVNSCFRAHGAIHKKHFPEFCRLAVGSWGIWVYRDNMDFDRLVRMHQYCIWDLYNHQITRDAARNFSLASILYVAFNDDENAEYSMGSYS